MDSQIWILSSQERTVDRETGRKRQTHRDRQRAK